MSCIVYSQEAEKRRAAAKLLRLLAKEQILREARGLPPKPAPVPTLPPSPTKTKKAPLAKKGGKLEAELVKQDDIALPVSKIPAPPCSGIPGALPFSYCALKTKAALSTGLGPKRGSTWLWFMVGDVDLSDTPGTEFLDVSIGAQKFQAGWVKDPTMSLEDKEIRPRQQAMLECVSKNSECEYGSKRKGVPVGFTHRWKYSDSQWECGKQNWATQSCEWWEQRQADRWEVKVSMRWTAESGCLPPKGKYVLVGEQRAEKINRNQYATAMRGALFPVGTEAEKKAVLERATRAYSASK
eukprot:Hpha_TRINITY_DN16209_c1_g15::TRINITY_DN16209_c1_g15_i1::g.13948::m.13948